MYVHAVTGTLDLQLFLSVSPWHAAIYSSSYAVMMHSEDKVGGQWHWKHFDSCVQMWIVMIDYCGDRGRVCVRVCVCACACRCKACSCRRLVHAYVCALPPVIVHHCAQTTCYWGASGIFMKQRIWPPLCSGALGAIWRPFRSTPQHPPQDCV